MSICLWRTILFNLFNHGMEYISLYIYDGVCVCITFVHAVRIQQTDCWYDFSLGRSQEFNVFFFYRNI